jgi:hypothetical protein
VGNEFVCQLRVPREMDVEKTIACVLQTIFMESGPARPLKLWKEIAVEMNTNSK